MLRTSSRKTQLDCVALVGAALCTAALYLYRAM